jgi:predicted lysophospholipase L1 biosynthesis ABC-type transport system permease subunit
MHSGHIKLLSVVCVVVGVALLSLEMLALLHAEEWSIPRHLGWPTWMGMAGTVVLLVGLEMGRRAATPGLAWLSRRWQISFPAGFVGVSLATGFPFPIVSTAAVAQYPALQAAICLLAGLSCASMYGALVGVAWEWRRRRR